MPQQATDFERFLDLLPSSAVILDQAGRIVAANPPMAHCLMVAPEEFVGRALADWAMEAAALRKFLAQDDPPSAELPFRAADGSKRSLALSLARDARSQTVIVSVTDMTSCRAATQKLQQDVERFRIDVTAQVLAERALRESEARLRRSQQHLERAQRIAAMGSSECEFATGIEEWSPETYRIFGVDPAAFVPTESSILALIHAEDRARVMKAMAMTRAGRCPPPGEFRVVRPSGEVRIVTCEIELLFDDRGAASRHLIVFKDVTEQRAAEARESEMQRQLLHSQKLEALGTLAGGIAHELNNTLVPVLALAKTTARVLPEKSRERGNLEIILQASERARDLVGRILAFSRKEVVSRRAVDLADLTRSALKLLRASLPATITLEGRISVVPPVMGDAGQLLQIVINLVTNAGQAIAGGLGTITVETAPAPAGADASSGAAVRLSVSDTGCGMDQATAARLFEPFFTTKPVGEGTGLGLSVVHGIIRQHGGRIAVESHVGAGTRFDVYLPALEAAAVEKQISAAAH